MVKLDGWAQVVIAAALAIIAAGIAWGHVSSQIKSDHDLLVEIRADVKSIRHEMRDIDRRLIYLEAVNAGQNTETP